MEECIQEEGLVYLHWVSDFSYKGIVQCFA
jgi:hypothetical protein